MTEPIELGKYFATDVVVAEFELSSKTHSTPQPSYVRMVHNGVEPWGDSNMLPYLIYKKVKQNTVAMGNFRFAERALNSAKLTYGKKTKDGIQPAYNPDIEAFIKQANLKTRYLPNAARELAWWYHFNAEFLLSPDRKQITSINIPKTMHCRYSELKDGRSSHVFLNANWELFPQAESPYTIKVPIVDTFGNTVENLRNAKNIGYKFMYPVHIETNGEQIVYPEPHWFSIDESGILDLVSEIWTVRTNLIKNGINPQYMIKFANWYFENRYENWGNKTHEQKKDCFKQETEAWSKLLANKENYGKAFGTMSLQADPRSQMPYPRTSDGIEIVPINSYIKNITEAYLADHGEASQHISFAQGVDPSVIGNAPGTKMGGGSGSDKHEAFNMFLTLSTIDMERMVEPLNFALEYNGLGNYEFQLEMPVLLPKSAVSPLQRESQART